MLTCLAGGKGAILSWSSAMVGAAVCFYISRILGRDIVEKLTSKTGLESVDRFLKNMENSQYSLLDCSPSCPLTL